MSGTIIEWAPFRVREGVSDKALMAASDAMQTQFLAGQPGFVSRQLLRGAEGEWRDLVVWENREAAEQVMKAAAESATCLRYFELMADGDGDPGAGVEHFELTRTYPALR